MRRSSWAYNQTWMENYIFLTKGSCHVGKLLYKEYLNFNFKTYNNNKRTSCPVRVVAGYLNANPENYSCTCSVCLGIRDHIAELSGFPGAKNFSSCLSYSEKQGRSKPCSSSINTHEFAQVHLVELPVCSGVNNTNSIDYSYKNIENKFKIY